MKQLTQNQQNLVLDHLTRAYAIVGKFNRTNVPIEDLQQAAAEGACLAALRYDETRNATFATFMYLYVFGEILYTIDLILGREPISIDDDNTDDYDENRPIITEPSETPHELIDNMDYVNRLLNHLNPHEREVIECIFGLNGLEPLTLTDAAKRFNTYPTKISRIYIRAINTLRTIAHNPNF